MESCRVVDFDSEAIKKIWVGKTIQFVRFSKMKISLENKSLFMDSPFSAKILNLIKTMLINHFQ
jgi:hypothetical protein